MTDSMPLPTTTYEADPAHVHRVLLLYSGGLDTSVMLKWIQERYDAEVVALTVNLGQPGEDFEVVRGKALRLGALECHVVDAREEFAREYVVPAIKANGTYGLGYPLFTALGRPLIAKLAVEYARQSGATRSPMAVRARATTRYESTPPSRRSGLSESDRAGAGLADGSRGGGRLRSRASEFRSKAAPRRRRTRSTTTYGGARARGAGSRISTTRPRTTSSSS